MALNRWLDATALGGVCLVLLIAFYYQLALGELPCAFCNLERVGFMLFGSGLLLNLRHGGNRWNYVLSAFGALTGSLVALLQVFVHVPPGTPPVGSAFLGLHMYVWAYLVLTAAMAYAVVGLALEAAQGPHDRWQSRIQTWAHGAVGVFIVVVAANFVSALLENGFHPFGGGGQRHYQLLGSIEPRVDGGCSMRIGGLPQETHGAGRSGGFGGGGGGGSGQPFFGSTNGGGGGFGGGGGGAEQGGGTGGFGGGGGLGGGGNGTSGFGASAPANGAGGSGAGLGGAVFVATGGTLTINGSSAETGSTVAQGGGGTGFGSGIFFEGASSGNAASTLTFGTGNVSVADAITDLNGAAGNATTRDGFTGANNAALTGGTTAVLKSGTGYVTLSGPNSYTGGTQLTGGEIVVGNNAALGSGALAMSPNTTLGFSTGGLTLANNVTVAGDPTYIVQTGQTDTVSGNISDAGNGAAPGVVEKAGGGTLTLTGNDTYSGGTTIANGTLVDAPTTAGGTSIGSGAVTFAGTSVGPAILSLGANAQPANGATFGNTLTNFGTYNGLDLQGVTFSNTAGNGAAFNSMSGVLTVTENGRIENFRLATPGNTQFQATNDGMGGTLVTAAPPVGATGATGATGVTGNTVLADRSGRSAACLLVGVT